MTRSNYMPKNGQLAKMDKFLGWYNLIRLNQEEIENINRPITHNEVENCDLKSSNRQKSRTRWLHG